MSDFFENTMGAFGRVAYDVAQLDSRVTSMEGLARVDELRLQSAAYEHDAECRRLKIIVDNYLEQAAISVSPEVWDNFPVENLLHPDRSLTMLTKSRSTHVIKADFDRPRRTSAFAMPYHSLSHWGQVRLELFAEADCAGELVYDSGLFYGRRRKPMQELVPYVDSWWATYGDALPQSADRWFDPVLAQSARITLSDQPADGYAAGFDVGMMFLGRYWSPRFANFDYGVSVEFEDDVKQLRGSAKNAVAEGTGYLYRRSEIDLNWLTEFDANALFEFFRTVGKHKEFFISAYPGNGNKLRELEHAFVARLEKTPRRSHVADDRYVTKAVVAEV